MTQVYLPPSQAWTFARLPAVMAAHAIDPFVVTHIGAHHGEEVVAYRTCGFDAIILVEPDPSSLRVLHDAFDDAADVQIIGAACVPAPTGPRILHLAERSVWSGLHPHPTASGYTVTVDTVAIHDVLTDANVLVLDTQGSELELLQAADLAPLDLVIVETTRRPGDGAALYDHATAYMHSQGWAVTEEWVHDNSGYTDTCFVKAARCA